MKYIFYICSIISIVTTFFIIFNMNPMNVLFCFIVSLLGMSGIFFSLGAYFAGALEIIIYAGAIMVLFIFTIMLLNLGKKTKLQEKRLLNYISCIIPGIISLVLISIFFYYINNCFYSDKEINIIDTKQVGLSLFSEYILVVEVASLILLCGLIICKHFSKFNFK